MRGRIRSLHGSGGLHGSCGADWDRWTDRQTDGQTDRMTDGGIHRLIPPPYGGGHNNRKSLNGDDYIGELVKTTSSFANGPRDALLSWSTCCTTKADAQCDKLATVELMMTLATVIVQWQTTQKTAKIRVWDRVPEGSRLEISALPNADGSLCTKTSSI